MSARTFDYEAKLDGFSGTVFWPCGGWGPGHPDNNYGEDCADDKRVTKGDDQVYRVSVEYQFTDDFMLYGTWGEGYRPGGLNRFCATRIPDGLGGQGENLASCDFRSDFLTSTEFGIKSTLMDGRMRLNAAVFWQDWEDFQFSRLDTSISPITLTYNVGDAESNGFEADFQVLLTDNWDLTGAVSLLSSELTSDYWRSPPDAADPNPAPPDAPAGTKLPRVPETKWNLGTRYHWNNNVYVQGTYAYTGDSFNTHDSNPAPDPGCLRGVACQRRHGPRRLVSGALRPQPDGRARRCLDQRGELGRACHDQPAANGGCELPPPLLSRS